MDFLIEGRTFSGAIHFAVSRKPTAAQKVCATNEGLCRRCLAHVSPFVAALANEAGEMLDQSIFFF
jgi:hypothetical protein